MTESLGRDGIGVVGGQMVMEVRLGLRYSHSRDVEMLHGKHTVKRIMAPKGRPKSQPCHEGPSIDQAVSVLELCQLTINQTGSRARHKGTIYVPTTRRRSDPRMTKWACVVRHCFTGRCS